MTILRTAKPSVLGTEKPQHENAFETIEIDQETIEVFHRVDDIDPDTVDTNKLRPRVLISLIMINDLQLEP